MIFDKLPDLGSKWTKAFWARGYYVAIGNITEDTIKRYIQNSRKKQRKKKQ